MKVAKAMIFDRSADDKPLPIGALDMSYIFACCALVFLFFMQFDPILRLVRLF